MKQISLIFSVIFLFLFLGTGVARAEFNYYDDFNSMNTQFWLIFKHGKHGELGPFTQDYSLGQIENGVLNLPVNTTDDGPELITKPIRISSNSVINVSWKSKVHYANEYFAGTVYFQLVNYDGFYPNNSDSFPPYKYFDANDDLKWKRLPTVYYRYYYYPYDNHYPEPRGGNSFGICGNGECLTSPPIWDQWFTNKVEINMPEGVVKFWQNDEFIGEVPINNNININETPYLRIWFSPYGWWTGHSMSLDWFSINVTENSDTGNGGECSNIDFCKECLPKFNMEDYSLYIPAINIGGENYELKFTLKSVIPEIVLKLDRCSESTCEGALIDACDNYIPSFDASTNKLHIPFLDLGGASYFFDFTLKDIIPFITFKLDNYGVSQVCNTTGNHGLFKDSPYVEDWFNNWQVIKIIKDSSGAIGKIYNSDEQFGWKKPVERIGDAMPPPGAKGAALYLHPVSAQEPTVLHGTYRINSPDQVLIFRVAGNTNGDWLMVVDINGVKKLEKIIDGQKWYDIKIPVGEYVGQNISVDLYVKANGWHFEYAFIDEIVIETDTDSGIGDTTSDTTGEIKNLVLSTQGYENNFFSFVSENYNNIENYDISAEPWCTPQPALCGNYVQVSAGSLNEITNIPTSGYLSDEAGFEDCANVEVNKVYINKNRDGSYTAFMITNATQIETTSSCDWNLEIQYKKIR